jgi:5-formyltetrahydrofolate cyclo-ligase
MGWAETRAWRGTARSRLIAARIALPAEQRAAWTARLSANLEPVLAGAEPPISFYWPIRAEPDLRPLMQALDEAGVAVALPVAIRLGEPLSFRRWQRGAEMERGLWEIPVPREGEPVVPRTLIAPLVGYDGENYRLGYGGGFFDRTLAGLGGRAVAIGVGFSLFALETIDPQPHDRPMIRVLTEQDPAAAAGASPVCYIDEAPAAYAGFLEPSAIIRELETFAARIPANRRALLDLALWRLGAPDIVETAERDPREGLAALLPRVRDDRLHAALRALRESL